LLQVGDGFLAVASVRGQEPQSRLRPRGQGGLGLRNVRERAREKLLCFVEVAAQPQG
jgi:hypothetical protein